MLNILGVLGFELWMRTKFNIKPDKVGEFE